MKIALMSVALVVLVIGASGPVMAADKPTTEGGTTATISTNDVATGITVSVEPNGRELKAVDKDGKTIWKVDLLKKWGEPSVGTAAIRSIAIRGDKIDVTIGKHTFGEVDIKTGKDEFKGSD